MSAVELFDDGQRASDTAELHRLLYLDPSADHPVPPADHVARDRIREIADRWRSVPNLVVVAPWLVGLVLTADRVLDHAIPTAAQEARRVDPRTLKRGDSISVWQFQHGGWYSARFERLTAEHLIVSTAYGSRVTHHLAPDALVAR